MRITEALGWFVFAGAVGALVACAAWQDAHSAERPARICSPVLNDRTLNGTNYHADAPPPMQMVCTFKAVDGSTAKEILTVPLPDRGMIGAVPDGPLPTSCDDGSCR